MNKRTEWQAEHDQPPTAEQMLAYSRGELSADEAARVWERLQEYPDLARAYTDPFPEAGAVPGDEDYVSDEEIGRRWVSFEKKVQRGRVVQFPRVLSAIAAALVVLLGGLLWQSQMKVRSLQRELDQPRALTEVVLNEDGGYRGASSEPTITAGQAVNLVLQTNADHHDEYRAQLRTAGSREVQWEDAVQRSEVDDFRVTLLRVQPGRYEVVLFGTTNGKRTLLGTYFFTVSPEAAAAR